MNILITYDGITKDNTEWGNWKGFMDELKAQNPDISFSMTEEILYKIDDEDITAIFKARAGRDITEDEKAGILGFAEDVVEKLDQRLCDDMAYRIDAMLKGEWV